MDVEFLDYANIASVPGLTETAAVFCTNRVTNANCDGSTDMHLKWAFTVSYAALRIRLKASFLNMHGVTISFTT